MMRSSPTGGAQRIQAAPRSTWAASPGYAYRGTATVASSSRKAQRSPRSPDPRRHQGTTDRVACLDLGRLVRLGLGIASHWVLLPDIPALGGYSAIRADARS